MFKVYALAKQFVTFSLMAGTLTFLSVDASAQDRPVLFPTTTKKINDITVKNFESGKATYCKNFVDGLLASVSANIQNSPSFIVQKNLSERFCKVVPGGYEFSGLSSITDDANNKFVIDRILYDHLVKGIGQLRKLAPNGADRVRINGAFSTLSGYVESQKLFSALEYDSNGVPTKGTGLLVDLYSSQLSHQEIAVKLGQFQSWIKQEVNINP